MITLKNSLAIAITIILAVVAYIISSAELMPALQDILASIFVVITAVMFFAASIATNRNSTSTNSTGKQVIESAGGVATLYIGNLAYKANEKTVQDYFSSVGTVRSVRLVKDKRTGRRKGFGFIEIDSKDESTFIKKLNESEFMERNIIVRPANEKQH